eukprot:CAMPEP_0203912712 /NCGR_PEP_ID=MMETSP0359-20131031/53756_1 /ASSEMBLY_ACC=CAM_ASM_000338 /TAXON_ID=268821 /ORGANISM="Scrippsiella Hangoei, Strain SHTV-5" /LENGTH=103 /DNA_ID=CAMNT_0050838703 /DNA_START=409 /DNA_END=721 /DNA_ORIENTATION=+
MVMQWDRAAAGQQEYANRHRVVLVDMLVTHVRCLRHLTHGQALAVSASMAAAASGNWPAALRSYTRCSTAFEATAASPLLAYRRTEARKRGGARTDSRATAEP